MEATREEGVKDVRYVLWDATGWQRHYNPPAWRNRVISEQKRVGWEMVVRIAKTVFTMLHKVQ